MIQLLSEVWRLEEKNGRVVVKHSTTATPNRSCHVVDRMYGNEICSCKGAKLQLFGIVNHATFWHFGHHCCHRCISSCLPVSFYDTYIQVLRIPVITEAVLSCFEHQDICLEPHPQAPILATSGFDHDIKLWLPTAEQPTDLDGLENVSFLNKIL